MRAYLYFLSAWRSFTAHKLRATLTTLGVVIGIASVIAMVSIVEGINRYVTESFSAIGGNLVYVSKREWFVMGRPTRQKLLEYARRPELTVEDAHALLTLPCDTPRLPVDLVPRLRAGDDTAIRVARDPERIHWLLALYPPGALAGLDEYLATGGRSVQGFVRTRPHRFVPFPETGAFANLNTPADLEALPCPR